MARPDATARRRDRQLLPPQQGVELGPDLPVRLVAVMSRRDVAHDQLAVVEGVAEQRLQGLRALEVEVQIVLPGEADAAVHLDGVAADLARRQADVGLADDAATAASSAPALSAQAA